MSGLVRRALLGLTAAALTPSVRTWVPLNDDTEDGLRTAWRWRAAEGRKRAGLGGGIAYTIDGELCRQVLPRFRDDILPRAGAFVTCERLAGAVAHAASAWSANNHAVYFVNAGPDVCSEGEDVRSSGCIEPELRFSVSAPSPSRAARRALQDIGAFTTAQTRSFSGVAKTNGRFSNSSREIFSATMELNGDACWYLDATFCTPLHTFGRLLTQSTVFSLLALLLFFGWAIALLSVSLALISIAYIIKADAVSARVGAVTGVSQSPTLDNGASTGMARKERAPIPALAGVIEQLQLEAEPSRLGSRRELAELVLRRTAGLVARRVWVLFPVWLLLLAPPLVFELIVHPCFECFDFEATILHELGHVLGLGHPSASATSGNNLYATERLSPSNCEAEEQLVRTTEEFAADALMNTQTRAGQPRCLAQDDLDGLNFLYPTCSNLVSTPRCSPSEHDYGYVRLGVILTVPLLLAFISAAAIARFTRYRYKLLRDQLHSAEEDLVELQAIERALVRRAQRRRLRLESRTAGSTWAVDGVGLQRANSTAGGGQGGTGVSGRRVEDSAAGAWLRPWTWWGGERARSPPTHAETGAQPRQMQHTHGPIGGGARSTGFSCSPSQRHSKAAGCTGREAVDVEAGRACASTGLPTRRVSTGVVRLGTDASGYLGEAPPPPRRLSLQLDPTAARKGEWHGLVPAVRPEARQSHGKFSTASKNSISMRRLSSASLAAVDEPGRGTVEHAKAKQGGAQSAVGPADGGMGGAVSRMLAANGFGQTNPRARNASPPARSRSASEASTSFSHESDDLSDLSDVSIMSEAE